MRFTPSLLILCLSGSNAYIPIPSLKSTAARPPISSTVGPMLSLTQSLSTFQRKYKPNKIKGGKNEQPSSSAVYAKNNSQDKVEGSEQNDILTQKKIERAALIRRLGGPLALSTPIGAMNPYGIYYGVTSILLGILWWLELTACRFLYFVTRNRIDHKRIIPNICNQIWGTFGMLFTRGFPEYVNMHILEEFYKTNRAAMFVANHNSWQDIPYLGSTIGWRNYKIIAKQELVKVPILSTAITVGNHVVVDRSDRRSQLATLKKGIQLLKDGVHLCTFPEGTRSKSGRLNKFKNGAFKMAHKAGAPVIPVSIVGAGKVMPVEFAFPIKRAKGFAKVVVHEPIESVGKTEDELAAAVRAAIISGLPQEQRPLSAKE